MHWIPRLFGIIPFGIGVTVLGFLWLTPFDQFGSPPLFFRVFGSFIALGFVMFGVAAFASGGLIKGQGEQLRGMMQGLAESARGGIERPSRSPEESTAEAEPKVGYDCPSCGAALGTDCDVSPSGDAKCQYCKRWFNIHNA